MHKALCSTTVADRKVRCQLCAHRCLIAEGRRGICQVRENRAGTLYTLVYAQPVARHIDPVEKKPLFHFYPGSTAYSLATLGCNFHCHFCQNWTIAQCPVMPDQGEGAAIEPAEIVAAALQHGCRSIAYTYTEPTVFFEYAYDIARQAKAQGIANILVSNGYQTPEALALIHPYLDAANVDLKGFSERFYRRIVGARLQPVLDTLKRLKALGVWLEVTTLIIPTLNDSEAELRELARFIATELGAETPWHVSRFFPAYKLSNLPPTPLATLHRAWEIGLEEGLRYVYEGNAPGCGSEHTYCVQCGVRLISRHGLTLLSNRIRAGCCPDCGATVDGVGMSGVATESLLTRSVGEPLGRDGW